jgi:TRAP-type C4-dicarboxylate transport system permease small subunit
MSELFKKLGLSSIEDLCAAVSGSLIVILMIITVIDVTGRYLFNSPLMGCVEISTLMLPAMVMLALSAAQRRDEHVGVDALIDHVRKFRPKIYWGFQVFALSVTELMVAFACFYSMKDLTSSIGMNETTSGPLYIIMWPTKILLCIGLILFMFRMALQIYESVRAIKKKEG